mmetsp:Transcript_10326/g.38331  ORF Transcript_10326/g.38331 Transcript_10326/m.38331 type:complete len:158 (-) Transcript_10326:3295-3768(-)
MTPPLPSSVNLQESGQNSILNQQKEETISLSSEGESVHVQRTRAQDDAIYKEVMAEEEFHLLAESYMEYILLCGAILFFALGIVGSPTALILALTPGTSLYSSGMGYVLLVFAVCSCGFSVFLCAVWLILAGLIHPHSHDHPELARKHVDYGTHSST